jgi:two-component system response regulator
MPYRNEPVLLVEDNPEDIELTQHAWQKARVLNPLVVFRDGAEVLDHLLADTAPPPPKVVLLDLKLPRIDGFEVLLRLRADARYRHLPVVVLTSSDQTPDIARAYAAGATSYIVKPVDFEKFVEAVGRVGLYWCLLNRTEGLPHP